ncbi:MAG: glycosyltransferase, partial [Planctomycetota bacterium]
MSEPVTVLSLNTERGWRGGENQVYLLQKGLAEAHPQIRSITACRIGEPLAERLLAEGLPCHPFACGGGFNLRAAWHLRRLIKRERVQVVHAHASHAHTLALLATWGLDVPVVV